MFIDAVTLIDETIENLKLLSQLFADELDERTHTSLRVTRDIHKSREALTASTVAIEKLKAARQVQASHSAQEQRVCANCDD